MVGVERGETEVVIRFLWSVRGKTQFTRNRYKKKKQKQKAKKDDEAGVGILHLDGYRSVIE